MKEILLFVVYPYGAVLTAVGVGIYRYFADRVVFTSRSSQTLENRALFWGSVSFHYAIIAILITHIITWIGPGAWQVLLSDPLRRHIVEVIGMSLAIAAFAGLLLLFLRHLFHVPVRIQTRWSDWLLVVVLLVQIATGLDIALTMRWGGLWSLDTATPWIRSLASLAPQTDTIIALPLLVKVHFINGFLLIGLFGFTRLMHIFTVPLDYLWRPWQVVWRGR